MTSYHSGDGFPCIVGEVGSYYTKMGFAGEVYPRSYFRSTTAILRGDSREPNKITRRSYDFFTRPLGNGGPVIIDNGSNNDSSSFVPDEGWESCNPVERSTGLIYEGGRKVPSSHNSNSDSSEGSTVDEKNNGGGGGGGNVGSEHSSSDASMTFTGECFTHFMNHLNHGYETAICADPSSAPLLLVERSYNPPPIRQKMVEMLFEELKVPAAFLARDAVCACYAVGRSTGTVVDIGHAGTVVTPVYEGYVENKGIMRSPVGSAMIEKQILEHLDALYKTKKSRMKLNSKHDYVMPLYQVRAQGNQRRKEPFHSLARLDVARLCKEDGSGAGVATFGYASLHDLVEGDDEEKPEPSEIYQQYAIAPKTPYKLPDGTQIDIPQTKRFDVAELFFGKEGGKSARIREEAVREANEKLNAMTAASGDTSTEVNPLEHIEEMTRRKRSGRNSSKKHSSNLTYEKLVKACTPYLTSAIGELTAASIPSMICDSAFRCDREQQAQLLGNAILCGGGACLSTSASSSTSVDYKDGNAMPERIRLEVESIIHTHTPQWRVKVSSPGLAERAVCSWLGASILGSLGGFHEMWITKAEYEEHGPSIVNRKCP